MSLEERLEEVFKTMGLDELSNREDIVREEIRLNPGKLQHSKMVLREKMEMVTHFRRRNFNGVVEA